MSSHQTRQGTITFTAEQRSSSVQHNSCSLHVPGGDEQVHMRLGYRRATDFDGTDDDGQDFAALRVSADGIVVGVIADGVSQSFFGGLAAARVGGDVLGELWRHRNAPPERAQMERALRRSEKLLKHDVEVFEVPSGTNQIVREMVDALRPCGSQAVFTAFVFDARSERARVYQVGDTETLVHGVDTDGKPLTSRVVSEQMGRYSSQGRSELKLSVADFERVQRILAKTDGAGTWGDDVTSDLGPSAFALFATITPRPDDVAFVAVNLGSAALLPPSPELADGEGVIGGKQLAKPHLEFTAANGTAKCRQRGAFRNYRYTPPPKSPSPFLPSQTTSLHPTYIP